MDANVFFRAIRGVLSLGVVGTSVYLWSTAQDVPDALSATVTMILGFYFGEKASKGQD